MEYTKKKMSAWSFLAAVVLLGVVFLAYPSHPQNAQISASEDKYDVCVSFDTNDDDNKECNPDRMKETLGASRFPIRSDHCRSWWYVSTRKENLGELVTLLYGRGVRQFLLGPPPKPEVFSGPQCQDDTAAIIRSKLTEGEANQNKEAIKRALPSRDIEVKVGKIVVDENGKKTSYYFILLRGPALDKRLESLIIRIAQSKTRGVVRYERK